MKDQNKARLNPAEMRAMLLSNASILMSERFMSRAPEVSGLKKTVVNSKPNNYKPKKAHS